MNLLRKLSTNVIVLNPYSSPGGGSSVQDELIRILHLCQPYKVSQLYSGLLDKSLRNIYQFYASVPGKEPSQNIYIIQSIFNIFSIVCIIACCRKNIKFIVIPRGDYVPKFSRIFLTSNFVIKRILWFFINRYLVNASAVVFGSYHELLHYKGLGITSPYCYVIPDPIINLEDAIPTQGGETFDFSSSYAIYLGRDSKEKNLQFIFDVWESLIKSCPDIKLLMVGPSLSIFDSYRISCNTKKMLHIIPWATEVECNFYIKSAKCVLLPSYNESFGLTVLNAIRQSTYYLASEYTPWFHISPAYGLCLPLKNSIWVKHLKAIMTSQKDLSDSTKKFSLTCYSTNEIFYMWRDVLEYVNHM